MKKLYMILHSLLISYSVYSQQQEWKVFKTPPPPIIKIAPSDYILPIALNGNRNKKFGTPANMMKSNQSVGFGSNSPYSETLYDNYIVCTAMDGTGIIWIGTFRGGVAKYDGTNWTLYNASNSGLPADMVYSLAVDKNRDLWIGTTYGLAKFDGKNWTVCNTSNSGIPNNSVYSLAIDKKGNKWIGTAAGLAKLNGKTWTVYNTSNSGIPNDYITAISIDITGNKWIGTFGGLVKYNGTNWKVYNTSNSGLPYNDIYSISLVGNGKVLIGTWGGGLARFNKNKWTVYKTINSGLPDNYISSLAMDEKGNMWIGTLAGLVKYDGTKWTIFNTSNSRLPDNMVYSLVIDKSGNLWIGTYNGLAVFKEGGIIALPDELSAFLSEVKNDGVTLTWQSETGMNTFGFEIERKANNSNWIKIGFVMRIGNSNSSYSFIDQYPISGKIFYRLKQIDFDGNYKYSKTADSFVGIPKIFFLEQNFPRKDYPAKKLELGLPENAFTRLVIYDVLGRKIETLVDGELTAGYHEIEFNHGNLSGGIYFCRVQAYDFISIRKLILIK